MAINLVSFILLTTWLWTINVNGASIQSANSLSYNLRLRRSTGAVHEAGEHSQIQPGNNLTIGKCDKRNHVLLHMETIKVENDGNCLLMGTFEFFLQIPAIMKCIEVIDQVADGTGAVPTYNSGGPDRDWVFVDFKGIYGKGLHFVVYMYGVPK